MNLPPKKEKEEFIAPLNSLDDSGVEISLMTWDLIDYYPSLVSPQEFYFNTKIPNEPDSL